MLHFICLAGLHALKAAARISKLVGHPRPEPLQVAESLSSTAWHLARTCAVLKQLDLLHKLAQVDQDYMQRLAVAVGYDLNNPGEMGRLVGGDAQPPTCPAIDTRDKTDAQPQPGAFGTFCV